MAAGGNLSPGMLLSAYRQGIFPWYSEGDPVLWWAPDPRFVILPGEIHVSRSMQRVLRRGAFQVTLDHDFAGVIERCSTTPRPGQPGTWITDDMMAAYCRLHRLGYAHSCEAWQEGVLAGGVYGVALGRVFFGESMFAHVSNASKAALIRLCRFLDRHCYELFDAQLYTPHVERMGGRAMPRPDFMRRVRRALDRPTMRGNWSELPFPGERPDPFSSGNRCPQ